MLIVNLAHGNLYAFGAYVSAWIIGYLAPPSPSARPEAARRLGAAGSLPAGPSRPRGRRPARATLLGPSYKPRGVSVLVTFGLLMIIDDVIPLPLGPVSALGQRRLRELRLGHLGDTLYPTYNFLVIGVGALAAIFLWAFIYRRAFRRRAPR